MVANFDSILAEIENISPRLADKLIVEEGWVWVCFDSIAPYEKSAILSLGFRERISPWPLRGGAAQARWGRPVGGPSLDGFILTADIDGPDVEKDPKPTAEGKSRDTRTEAPSDMAGSFLEEIKYGGKQERIAAKLSENFAKYGLESHFIRSAFEEEKKEAPGLVYAAWEGGFLSFAGEAAERIAAAFGQSDRVVNNGGISTFCIVQPQGNTFPVLSAIGVHPVLVGSLQRLMELNQPTPALPVEHEVAPDVPEQKRWKSPVPARADLAMAEARQGPGPSLDLAMVPPARAKQTDWPSI